MPLPARWRRHPVAGAVFLLGALLALADLWRWLRVPRPDPVAHYTQRADWSADFRGEVHFSGYVFRDRNRSGRYDLGDLPLAGVAVEMAGKGGESATEISNLGGFANFRMSRFARQAAIRKPGEARFRVLAPPGMQVTSGNGLQSTEFFLLAGSPAGLVARNPTQPVGLAPELYIAGRVAGVSAGVGDDLALTAIGPDGARSLVRLSENGSFRVPAAPGPWTLSAERIGSAARVERQVRVRDAPIRMAAMNVEVPAGPVLGAPITVDFESVTGALTAKIPGGTGGVDWNYLTAITPVGAGAAGYMNTLSSGSYVGYSSSGHPVTISRDGGFDFYGGYFGAGLPEAEGETLLVQAFRGDLQVAEDEIVLSHLRPLWFDADYRNIDRLVLTTLHYWQFVTDDLVIAAPVP